MKFLTIDDIRQHCRIDFNDEDAVLELYGAAAEDTMLNTIGRGFDELLALYGEVPAPLRQATLLLTASSYQHREPSSAQNQSVIPYAFDILVKPYMRLADRDGESLRRVQKAVLGSDIKLAFNATLPDGLLLSDVGFTVTVCNTRTQKKRVYQKDDCIYDPLTTDYVVPVSTDDFGIGQLMMKAVIKLPDTDYPSGYRREVVNINPYTHIIG